MPLKDGKDPFQTESLEQDDNLESQHSGEIETESQIDEEEIKNWDKEKSIKAYRNLQRKINETRSFVSEATERAIRAEERAKLLEDIVRNNPQQQRQEQQQEKPPVKPVKPIKPAGYNKADAIAYPDSESAKYDEAIEKYYEAKETYEDWRESHLQNELKTVRSSFEEEQNRRLQSEDYAKRKAGEIARLAKATGGDIQKATAVFDFVQKAMVKDDPSFYVSLYDVATSKKKGTKEEEEPEIVSSRNNSRRPLSTANSNFNEGDEVKGFMTGIKSQRRNNHSLFKTESKS